MDVILCRNCEGHGSYLAWENSDRVKVDCSRCNGSGRMLIKEYTVEVPLDTDPDLYSSADETIIKIIKELEISIKS